MTLRWLGAAVLIGTGLLPGLLGAPGWAAALAGAAAGVIAGAVMLAGRLSSDNALVATQLARAAG